MKRSPTLALFEAFPALERRLPRHIFLSGPTPVERLTLPGVPRDALWVKRDDRSSPLYGGNKPRKLEFLIGDARARGARRLVTTGGLGTHHGLATAILGRSAGLATSLVLLHQPVTEEVRRSLLLFSAWGAELVYGANVPGTAAQILRVLARSALRGERPYRVPTGGSGPLGAAGFVSAGLELAAQVRAGALPEPSEIWVPVGTGGTLAGLAAGLALAGLRTRVTGVLVTDILPPTPGRLARMARAALRRLRRLDPSLPEVALTEDPFDWVSDQVGEGYGASTPAAEQAVAAATRAGLRLEATYTGKCMAALIERLRRPVKGPILFWNTFSGVDVEAAAPGPLEPARLPPRFRRFVERDR